MKTIAKSSSEPCELTAFRTATPCATWDDAHDYRTPSQKSIPQVCSEQCRKDQYNLCAYCEIELTRTQPQVEHFHPKSDTSNAALNYALIWDNMLAVCDGGKSHEMLLRPKYKNLHCDAHKNVVLQKNAALSLACEQYFLNPLTMSPAVNLFTFDKKTGELHANAETCAQTPCECHAYATTRDLVENTIIHLNLNAYRLCELRRKVFFALERAKHAMRRPNISPQAVHDRLAERFFHKKWPEFFTTYRCLLGKSAEAYLQRINYEG